MSFIHPYKTNFFLIFFVFLLYNDVYFEYTQGYKKDDSKKAKKLYLKTIIDELDLLKKTVID